MKRRILILLCALFSICAYSQEHLKFMGIPLNMTINDFQQKLQAKNVRVDYEINRTWGPGGRVFKGKFSKINDCHFIVFYNTKSKIVYRVKVIIERYDEDIIKSIFSDFVEMLDAKYGTGIKSIDEEDQSVYNTDCGKISIWYEPITYKEGHSVHIDYQDSINSDIEYMENMEDL